ncbi:substrate-binding domain-containing protein [Enterovibrio sp. ZSDZ42]|uniref:Autoinducer 2-binding periplasmic protein LuxP n=1 Tax=Enterovibrio gelatinilyticus TaxID=2899819 RepID=A0ABT5QWQ0_9GAMM|nr:substrate-binding domain-containing protein [Enterovibrio sp. ZSDZ42]MDD1791712.1 substrate-binding domain-containing protein [Enterovibrio sp. ZSDZ42]
MRTSKAICGLLLFIGCVLSPWSQAGVVAGISVSDLTNPYFVTMVRSLRDELQTTFGDDVRLLVRSSAYNHPRQVRQLEEFVAEKVDLIFLVASDEYKIGPAVKNIVSQGTPIFAIDVRASGATATITTDNMQAGEIACEGLASGLKTQGNILIINGPQVSSVIERVEGCKLALKQYPHLVVISDSLNGTASIEGGLESMAYALQAYSQIDGVFAINDRTALGAEQAIVQANANTLIMSVDGSPAARDALIQKRKSWLGTATQFPDAMSKEAVKIAAHWLESQDDVDVDVDEMRTEVLIPTKLMTPNNAQSFTAW